MEKKDFWFKLYQHDSLKKNDPLAVQRIEPFEMKIPRTKARDYIGIDPNRMAKVLNELFREKLNSRWHNLVLALQDKISQSKTVAIKKNFAATSLEEARAIGIIPYGVRLLDNNLTKVKEKLQSFIKENHPTQFAFLPGRSTLDALENIDKSWRISLV